MNYHLFPLPGGGLPPVRALINGKCIRCGLCLEICPAQAIRVGGKAFSAGAECIGCAACVEICPSGAAVLIPRDGGQA